MQTQYNDFGFRGKEEDYTYIGNSLKDIELIYLHPSECIILDKMRNYNE